MLAWVLSVLLLSPSTIPQPAVTESLILGDWCAGSATAFHEEFSLTVEDGKRLFSSWLHQRPAESGTWVLRGRTLTIKASSGLDYVYSIERVNAKRLVLREDQGEPEVYVRTGCRRFEGVPDDHAHVARPRSHSEGSAVSRVSE